MARLSTTRYGGSKDLTAQSTGFFRVERLDDRYWLVDPDGGAFFAVGTCRTHHPGAELAQRIVWAKGRSVSETEWTEHTAQRLLGWGFNFDVGRGHSGWHAAWTGKRARAEPRRVHAPYTGWVNCSYRFGAEHGVLRGPGVPHYMTFIDIFDSRWDAHVRAQCQRLARPYRKDPWLVGYYTDNELFWGWGIGPGRSLLDGVLYQHAKLPAKRELVRFLRERYRDDLPSLRTAWNLRVRSWDALAGVRELPAWNERVLADKKAFLYHWARHYARTVDRHLKAADPNHLNLGCRIHGNCEPELAIALGESVDVISYNKYDELAPAYQIEEMLSRHARRPVIVSEWGFRAEDAGLPNTGGVGRLVRTQAERGKKYARFLEGCARSPACVGAVWYAYVDDPMTGTDDPVLVGKRENSNYGLCDERDQPYAPMVRAVERANRRAVSWHAEGPTPSKDLAIVCPRDFFFQPNDTFSIQGNGVVTHQDDLRAFLQGSELGFDSQSATFEVDLARKGRFAVWVYQVEKSPVLELSLDGKVARRVKLPAAKSKGKISKLMPKGWQSVYDEEYSISVPAGAHRIRVRNAGTGWIWLNAYRLSR